MNKETRLILENQLIIIRYLWLKDNEFTSADGTLLSKQMAKTREFLEPKESNTEQRIKKALLPKEESKK